MRSSLRHIFRRLFERRESLYVTYLSPGPPSPPGSYTTLSPGHTYEIRHNAAPFRSSPILTLLNDFGTPLGFLEVRDRDERPSDEPMGTCDWGDCDEPVVAWRWADSHGWLPVCPVHQIGPPR